MEGRTRIGASGDKNKTVSRVEKLLTQLDKPAFDALTAPKREELLRRGVVLLLEIMAKRLLK